MVTKEAIVITSDIVIKSALYMQFDFINRICKDRTFTPQ